MTLELLALRWLRFEKNCMLALRERSPRQGYCGQPDALGITPARYTIEVEIKRSASDFRVDAYKQSRRCRTPGDVYYDPKFLSKAPKLFYYLVPHKLADKVTHLVPEWAGLLVVNQAGYDINVVKDAPVNRESKRLTLKESVRLAHMLSNYNLSLEERHANIISNYDTDRHGYPQPEFAI